MTNMEIVKKMAKLNILCARYSERHNIIRCKTWRDIDRLITGNKLTIKYKDAADVLYNNISKICGANEYLVKSALELKVEIYNSDIKDLRLGLEPQRKFTDEENKLDQELIRQKFFYNSEMLEIKEAVEILNGTVTESAIKQACQQERLLNTQKIGKTWLVSGPECRAYWNIPDPYINESKVNRKY